MTQSGSPPPPNAAGSALSRRLASTQAMATPAASVPSEPSAPTAPTAPRPASSAAEVPPKSTPAPVGAQTRKITVASTASATAATKPSPATTSTASSTATSPAAPNQAALLAALAQLEQRVRACQDEASLGFLMVNQTHALAPYRQAALWLRESENGEGRIIALSGLAVPDPHAPFNTWLARLLAGHADRGPAQEAGNLAPPADPADAAMWQEHLPAHAWWLPLPLQGQARAGLLLLREKTWSARETTILALAADAYAHAWRALRPRGLGGWRSRARPGRRRNWLIGLGVLLVLLALPVRQSVLAPAEVVARAPETVRAPLQGVVDRMAVMPNETVHPGQLLAALDARELLAKLEAARQTLAVAEAESRQGQQQALFDERSKSTLALLQGKRDQAAADVDYYTQALARTELRAERAGIALFDDPSDWVGRPVALGERIMQVADPKDAELDIQLPIADAITLPDQAAVRLFLNADPAAPIAASVLRVGYRAAPGADGSLAYRVRARFDEPPGEVLRVGLKGTAKLYGERTVLGIYLLRRPLATLRVWLGL